MALVFGDLNEISLNGTLGQKSGWSGGEEWSER